jgi:hypothetical protein
MCDQQYQEESNKYVAFQRHMEQKFPTMFAGKYGGFEIGAGWFHIVEELCTNIEYHLRSHPQEFTVDQVKEKFGSLRFHTTGGDGYIYGLIRLTESWAENTCEVCGNRGKLRGGRWMRTLCDEHAN